MKILMVLTSHDELGETGEKTGFWLEEFAAPYYIFKDQNAVISLASPKGGQPPLDPKSDQPDFHTDATARFQKDEAAQQMLATTLRLDSVKAEDYDAVFYPGGHGPLWDLTNDKKSIELIEEFNRADKPIGLVCHAPGVLKNVSNVKGSPFVSGKKITGFSNSEEEAVGLTKVVPFLLEDMVQENGGIYSKGEDWGSYVEVDGKVVTGQNPASSEAAAKELIKLIM
jgi:putative intracellular protease/amidase